MILDYDEKIISYPCIKVFHPNAVTFRVLHCRDCSQRCLLVYNSSRELETWDWGRGVAPRIYCNRCRAITRHFIYNPPKGGAAKKYSYAVSDEWINALKSYPLLHDHRKGLSDEQRDETVFRFIRMRLSQSGRETKVSTILKIMWRKKNKKKFNKQRLAARQLSEKRKAGRERNLKEQQAKESRKKAATILRYKADILSVFVESQKLSGRSDWFQKIQSQEYGDSRITGTW